MDNNSIDDRHIRVFISSTFQDMEKEREQLIKKVFPVLRKKAAQRGVTLTELDLRWGITQEESENGKVLEICLKEIDNSRPFFIGLLGDRYGWCPSEEELVKNHNIEEMFPWVRQAISEGKSVTEMEFLYGALFPKSVSKHIDAFFWIKNGPTGSDERLERLKQMVRDNSEYPCNDYSSPEDLGAQVTAAFEKILEERFPPQRLSEIETFQLEQELYRRTLEKIYVPIEKNLSCLENFLQDDKQTVLALIGDSGSGKSATISNWLKAHSDDKNFDFIYCFLQASNKGADINSVLEYLDAELLNLLGIETQENILGNNNNAEEAFKKHFAEVTSDRKLVLILDGVNILDDLNDKLLNWIPRVPDGSKIILSTLESDITYQSILRKEYHTEMITLLDDNQLKTKYVKSYLGQYGKTLTEKQTQRLIASPITATPDALRSILNELKNNSSYNKLDNTIEQYVKIQSIEELFKRIIVDTEEIFDKNSVGLILISIALSRNGLDETTIINISGMSQLMWSQFFCYFNEHLFCHQGLISFSNKKLKEVLLSRYLNSDYLNIVRRNIICHLDLSEYKDNNTLEILFQQWKLKDYLALIDFLSSGYSLSIVLQNDKTNLRNYWKIVQDSRKTKLRFYTHIRVSHYGAWGTLGNFMNEMESYGLSAYYSIREIIKDIIGLHLKRKDNYVLRFKSYIYFDIIYALNNLGISLFNLGYFKLAIVANKLLLLSIKKHPNGALCDSYLLKAKTDIAMCYSRLGKTQHSEAIYDCILHEDNLDDTEDEEAKAISLTYAIGTYARTDTDKAKECFDRAQKIYARLLESDISYCVGYLQLLNYGLHVINNYQEQKKLLEGAVYLASTAETMGLTIPNHIMNSIYLSYASTIWDESTSLAQQYCDLVFENYISEDRIMASGSLLQLLRLYTLSDENEKAKKVLDRLLNLPPDFSRYISGSDLAWAELYFCQGKLEISRLSSSKRYLKKSISIFERNEVRFIVDKLFCAMAYYYYGLLLNREKKYKCSILNLEKSVQLLVDISGDNYNLLCISAKGELSYAYLKSNRLNDALALMEENREVIKSIPQDHPNYYLSQVQYYAVMEDIYLCQGDVESAMSCIEKAIDAANIAQCDEEYIRGLSVELRKLKQQQ